MKCIILFVLLMASVFQLNAEFKTFHEEVERAETSIKFGQSKITPASDGWGALFGNICGRAETVKFFINEEPKTGGTKSVKFIWNDWFLDRGYGVHPDKKEAKVILGILSRLYVPELESQLDRVFFEDRDQLFESNGFSILYTYHRGPAIDERVILVKPLNHSVNSDFILQKEDLIGFLKEFAAYEKEVVEVDMEPTEETGYKSFFAKGESRDVFFIEIHDNGEVRIKAAYSGKYPFKYVGFGKWK